MMLFAAYTLSILNARTHCVSQQCLIVTNKFAVVHCVNAGKTCLLHSHATTRSSCAEWLTTQRSVPAILNMCVLTPVGFTCGLVASRGAARSCASKCNSK